MRLARCCTQLPEWFGRWRVPVRRHAGAIGLTPRSPAAHPPHDCKPIPGDAEHLRVPAQRRAETSELPSGGPAIRHQLHCGTLARGCLGRTIGSRPAEVEIPRTQEGVGRPDYSRWLSPPVSMGPLDSRVDGLPLAGHAGAPLGASVSVASPADCEPEALVRQERREENPALRSSARRSVAPVPSRPRAATSPTATASALRPDLVRSSDARRRRTA